MFRFLAIAITVAAVSAFSSVGRVAKTASLNMVDFSKEIGVQPPLGFWDPLGLLADGEQATFDQFRTCEIKHGRIAMLAVLGHIVTTKGDRFPGDLNGVPFSSIKAGLAAFDSIPTAGLFQLFFFIGLMELGYSYVAADIEAYCKKDMTNRGWSEAVQRNKAAIELNNGRAAQMGILGLVVHEKLNNDPYVLNSLLGFPVAFNQ